jgi:cysteine-S-conjugate beta-lyase
MHYDFDQIIKRTDTDSVKWGIFPGDVIPLWVADMDFRSAEPIIRQLKERIDHGIFGYSRPSQNLIRALQERVQRLYGWGIEEQEIIFLPGIVAGINIAIQAYSEPGEGILAQPPVYFHFLRDPLLHGRTLHDPVLVKNRGSYEIDFDRFEKAITPDTRIFLLCNPHNPVGRVYTKTELEMLAEICLRHNLLICSDEIHCDLVFPPHRHIPIATLGREIEDRTITLMAPSKTYNIAGLDCGYGVIKSAQLRKRWRDFSYGLIPGVNIAGHVAALAALEEGQEWLEQVLVYLEGNRDYLLNYFQTQLPEIQMSSVEGTYLAWLDCTNAGIIGKPSEFFLKNAGVALSDGDDFGKGGVNFVRLNFACPRKRLVQALDRINNALKSGIFLPFKT